MSKYVHFPLLHAFAFNLISQRLLIWKSENEVPSLLLLFLQLCGYLLSRHAQHCSICSYCHAVMHSVCTRLNILQCCIFPLFVRVCLLRITLSMSFYKKQVNRLCQTRVKHFLFQISHKQLCPFKLQGDNKIYSQCM